MWNFLKGEEGETPFLSLFLFLNCATYGTQDQ